MSPTTQPWTSTATELAARLRSGDLSATELARSLLDRIAQVDGDVRAFITVTPEVALAKARAVDDARARGEDPPAGIPVRGGRAEADVWSRLPVRPHRLRLVAGPGGTVRPNGCRRGAPPRCDGRSRSPGLHLPAEPRARLLGRTRRRRGGP